MYCNQHFSDILIHRPTAVPLPPLGEGRMVCARTPFVQRITFNSTIMHIKKEYSIKRVCIYSVMSAN